jgi:hypothetical protein
VWSNWASAERRGGFDAVIGNPPWDRLKLEQVKWFEAHKREIAMAQRAADRQRMIAAIVKKRDPLAKNFAKANARAEAAFRVARASGDYPLLSGGDLNIYSLFVERKMTLVKQSGMVGLLTPIGIATDKTSSEFFSRLATRGSLKTFLAFENKRGWLFPDIHHEEQPSVIVFSARPEKFTSFDFCVRVSAWDQFNDPERRFLVSAASLRCVNPNTGTAPMFRTRRDATLTTAIYGRLPILVERSSDEEVKTWPVRYATMFHMTNDSNLFRTRKELDEQEGAYPIGGNRFRSAAGDWLPLYEGKMIQIVNHRYASVRVNPRNVSGQGVTEELTSNQLRDHDAVPDPRYWVKASDFPQDVKNEWRIGFNDICNTNNSRSVIASIVPIYAFGNTLPTYDRQTSDSPARIELLAANLASLICDYVARQKIQSRHLNKYIIEQLPVVPPDRYDAV